MYQKLAELFMKGMQSTKISSSVPPTMDCLFQLKQIYVPSSTDFNDHDALPVFLEIRTDKQFLTSQLYLLPSRQSQMNHIHDTSSYPDQSMLCYDLSHDQVVGILLSLVIPPSSPSKSIMTIHCTCILYGDMHVECGSCVLDVRPQTLSNRTVRMLFNKDSPLKGGYCDIQMQFKEHEALSAPKVECV